MPAASIIAGLTALASGVGKGVKAKKDNDRAGALADQEQRDANQAELSAMAPSAAGVIGGPPKGGAGQAGAMSQGDFARMSQQGAAPRPPPAAPAGQIPMQGSQYGRRPGDDESFGRY